MLPFECKSVALHALRVAPCCVTSSVVQLSRYLLNVAPPLEALSVISTLQSSF